MKQTVDEYLEETGKSPLDHVTFSDMKALEHPRASSRMETGERKSVSERARLDAEAREGGIAGIPPVAASAKKRPAKKRR